MKIRAVNGGVRLGVPYKRQLDNAYEPYRTCNLTCCAMVAAFYNVVGNGQGQLEDQMYRYAADYGHNKHAMEGMAATLAAYGVRDPITYRGTWAQLIAHLDAGRPAIVHGYFDTVEKRYEHIVCVVGYERDLTGRLTFLIHDPYGEFFKSGYRTDLSGEYNRYSAELFRQCFGADGDIWLHRPVSAQRV
jgi:hypothetical protein